MNLAKSALLAGALAEASLSECTPTSRCKRVRYLPCPKHESSSTSRNRHAFFIVSELP